MLQVLACRDQKQAYLAIESPCDLTWLGALTPAGELLTVAGKPLSGTGRVVELAIPLKGQLALTIPSEVARRTAGKLPPEFTALGLDRLALPGTTRDYRKPWLWLQPRCYASGRGGSSISRPPACPISCRT